MNGQPRAGDTPASERPATSGALRRAGGTSFESPATFGGSRRIADLGGAVRVVAPGIRTSSNVRRSRPGRQHFGAYRQSVYTAGRYRCSDMQPICLPGGPCTPEFYHSSRRRFLILHGDSYGAVCRTVQRLHHHIVRYPSEDDLGKYADAKPLLRHGHDGMIVPGHEFYIGVSP